MNNRKRIISAILSLTAALTAVTPTTFAKFNKAEYEGKPLTSTEFFNMMKDPYANGEFDEFDEMLGLDLSNVVTGTNEVDVTINENKVRPMTLENLSVQCEFSDSFATFFETDGSLRKDYVEFAKTIVPFPTYRWGGTSSTLVNYMDNIGPFEQRTGGQPMVDFIKEVMGSTSVTQPAMQMGPAEYIKMMYANNPDAALIPCPSVWAMTPEEIGQFAHYLYDEADESEWGALRAADGIKEPVKVFYWEMTNEIDKYSDVTKQYGIEQYDEYLAWYCETVRETVRIIREIEPEAKVITCGPTAPWGRDNWYEWHQNTMEQLADIVDGISFHPYYDGVYAEQIMKTYVDPMKADMDEIVKRKDIRDKDGNLKDMKIIATEASRWFDPNTWNRWFTVSHSSALSNAQYLNLALSRDFYVGSTHHGQLNDLWGMMVLREDGWYAQPTAKVWKMYNDYLGDRMVEADFDITMRANEPYKTDDNWSSPRMLSANTWIPFSIVASAKGDNELTLFIVSKDPYNDLNVNFKFNNNYTLVEEVVYSAPNITTYPRNRELDAAITVKSTPKNIENFSSYHIGPARVVALRLKTNGKIPYKTVVGGGEGEGEIIVDSTGSFADIQSHWAKSEIAYMQQNGIVSGVDATHFMPNNSITNAEITAIAAKALGLSTGYTSSAFIDVYDWDWYAPYANAMKAEGMIRGREFNPNSVMSVVDLCKFANSIYEHRHPDAKVDPINVKGTEGLSAEDRAAVNQAAGYGLISRLYENGLADFTKTATRAEATSVLYRIYTGL